MRTKLDITALEHSIDFQAVTKKLDNLSANGPQKRQSSVADLLDKVRPALLRARQNKISLAALTAALQESGLSISEATLRRYLHAHGVRRKTHHRKVKIAPLLGQPAVELPPKTPSNLPPRLARRINH
ncbi:hypothetical protein BH09VER1_BH09VER1_14210 [soil metagenome]